MTLSPSPHASGQAIRAVQGFLDALRARVRPSVACDVGAARLLVVAGAMASIANARENLLRIRSDTIRTHLEQRLSEVDGPSGLQIDTSMEG